MLQGIQGKLGKYLKMARTKKEPLTPRRRVSLSKTGAMGKVTKALLTRPTSNTASVAPVCNIKVVVRVRPPNAREQDDNFHNVVKVLDEQSLIFDPKEDDQPFFYHGVQQKSRDLLKKAKKDITFVFDKVFSNACTNLEVFTNSTKSLIDVLMDGCNCSVFAYGATGAGKTFTMIGTAESPGITYLTMKDLFRRKKELSADREFELMVTYIEVYNELVKDLLNPGPPLNLREDAKYGVMIPGVKGHKVARPRDLFSLLEQGNKRRTQHPTDANAESSRSHAVFQVYIQMTMKGTREVRRAKLSMIDLAGSERGSATGFVGARFKEGANINKSLLALGNCINSLADGHRHVPYRDSKLTRLLKDSLGGNCHTIMIANVSPSSMSFDDTYNTLKYAVRAKKIKSNIKRNIVNVDMHIDQYIKLVEDLQNQNSALKSENIIIKKELDQLRAELEQQTNSHNTQESKNNVGGHKTNDVEITDQDNPKKQNESTLSASLDKSSTEVTDEDMFNPLESVKQTTHDTETLKTDHGAESNGGVITERIAADAVDSLDKRVVDMKTLSNFRDLIEGKKKLMEREFQLQSSELGMSLRRELKTETKNRLSSFYVHTPDKEEVRKKLNEQVERSEKKEKSTNAEIEEIKLKKDEIEEKLEGLVVQNPLLSDEYKYVKIEFAALECRYKSDLKQKENEVLVDDHKDKYSILESMAKLLKMLFLSVGGKDDAPESIKREYENLVAIFNGKKHLRWQEGEASTPPDSGVANVRESDEQKKASKRKCDTDSQVPLDSTFTREQGKSPGPIATKSLTFGKNTVNPQMVAKGFKAPAAKRFASGFSPRHKFSPGNKISPRSKVSPRNKENCYTRKPASRPETVGILTNVKRITPKAVPKRPRFKM